MPRFAANLSYLHIERPFVDRFEAARRSGFQAVEFHFPYAFDASELAAAAREAGVEIVLFNLPAGDWVGGERGIACLPDRIAEFRAGVERAIDHAQRLGCRQLNCLAGIRPGAVPQDDARSALVANLRYASKRLASHGIRLLLEAINDRDMPGFFVNRSRDALALLDEVGSDNLLLQYDLYHAQVMEGDLARTLERQRDRIGHIQLADNPGRHEPGTGEISFPFLFGHLDRIGYRGWIGCEYVPSTTTEASLSWARGYLEPRA